jgi:hypothetical protein
MIAAWQKANEAAFTGFNQWNNVPSTQVRVWSEPPVLTPSVLTPPSSGGGGASPAAPSKKPIKKKVVPKKAVPKKKAKSTWWN